MKPIETLIKAFEKTDLGSYAEDIKCALECYDGKPNADDFADWYKETYIYSAGIFYSQDAIEYLKENDPSLEESLVLAFIDGVEQESLNSTTLASILLRQNLTTQLYELRGDLENYFSH